MKKTIILLILMSFFVELNSKVNGATVVLSRDLDYMSTVISITLYEGETADLDAIEAIYRVYDHLADNYNGPDMSSQDPLLQSNNLYSINESRGISPVIVDTRLIDLIEDSLSYYSSSNGYFNPAIGLAIDLWKNVIFSDYMYTEIPTQLYDETIAALSALSIDINPNDIVIDRENSTVYISNTGLKLDLGAVAKGYATQKVYEYLVSKHITHYLVNAGRSNILLGIHPDETETNSRPFRVGMQDPLSLYQNGYTGIIETRNKAVVSSGNYEQYVTYQGRVYHHIISPFDLVPKQYYHVVTLIGDNSAMLDAYSTAIFSMNLEEAKAFITEQNIEGILYLYDGTVETVNLTTPFTQSDLIQSEDNKNLSILYWILGGVIVGGIVLFVILSIFEKKKKGDSIENQA